MRGKSRLPPRRSHEDAGCESSMVSNAYDFRRHPHKLAGRERFTIARTADAIATARLGFAPAWLLQRPPNILLRSELGNRMFAFLKITGQRSKDHSCAPMSLCFA